jgi:hypothetical protein
MAGAFISSSQFMYQKAILFWLAGLASGNILGLTGLGSLVIANAVNIRPQKYSTEQYCKMQHRYHHDTYHTLHLPFYPTTSRFLQLVGGRGTPNMMGQAVEPVSVLTVEDVTAMGVLVYQMVQQSS